MKRLLWLLLCGLAFGQSPVGIPVAVGPKGNPLANVTVAICTSQPNLTTPCGGSSVLQTFTTSALSVGCALNSGLGPMNGTGCTNPGLTDQVGNVLAYGASAGSWCQYYGPQVSGVLVVPCQIPVSGGGVNTVGNLNGVEIVDGVRNANIAAAIAHLPSQCGVVALPSHYRETITSHINLGNGTPCAVVIVGYGDDILSCAVPDGTYCFKVNNNSGFIGLNPWANGTFNNSLMILSVTGMNVPWMVVPSGVSQASMILEKVSIIEDGSGPAPTQGCLQVDGIGNLGIFRDIYVQCRGAIGWQISAVNGFTGPFSFDNVWSLNVNVAGGVPCKILGGGNSLVGISLIGGTTCNDAGAGLPSLSINGNSNSGGVKSVVVSGGYAEMNCVNNNQIGIQVNDAWNVSIIGSYVPCAGAGGTGSSGIVISQSAAGRTRNVSVINTFSQNTAGGCVLSNTITTECGPANINTQSNLAPYTYTADSALAPVTVSGGSDSRWVNQSGTTEAVIGQAGVTMGIAAVAQLLNQNNAHVWADASACVTSTKAITFGTAYNSTPAIFVFDETTKGGANITAKSASGFTVSCTGATDAFDWLAVGNPN